MTFYRRMVVGLATVVVGAATSMDSYAGGARAMRAFAARVRKDPIAPAS